MLDPINQPFPAEDTIFADSNPQSVPNAADIKRRRIEAHDRQKHLEAQQMGAVLATEAGQAVFMRLLAYCEPLRQINMGEHQQAALLEGRRRVGLWIIDQMQHVDPDLYARMITAHLKRLRAMNDLADASTRAQ